MPNLTNMELDNLREIIMEETLAASKLADYAQTAIDDSLKKYLNKASQDAARNVQSLRQFLS